MANRSNKSDIKISENPDRNFIDTLEQRIPLFSQVAKENGSLGNSESPSKLLNDRTSTVNSILQGPAADRDSAMVFQGKVLSNRRTIIFTKNMIDKVLNNNMTSDSMLESSRLTVVSALPSFRSG